MYVYLEIFGLQYLNCAFTALNTFVANVYTRIFIFLRDCLIGWRFEKLYPHNSLVITLDGFISCRFFCLYPEFFWAISEALSIQVNNSQQIFRSFINDLQYDIL